MILRSITLLLAAVAIVSACGGDGDPIAEETRAATTTTATEPPPQSPAVRVGLVTAVGGPFNALAVEGLERAESELGVEGRVLVSRTNAAYVPNLSRLAEEGYDLVIAAGSSFADALDTVAKQFPTVDFAIVDVSREDLPSTPRNVRGLLFEEEEAG